MSIQLEKFKSRLEKSRHDNDVDFEVAINDVVNLRLSNLGSIAAKFNVSTSVVQRWFDGEAVPSLAIRESVFNWIKELASAKTN